MFCEVCVKVGDVIEVNICVVIMWIVCEFWMFMFEVFKLICMVSLVLVVGYGFDIEGGVMMFLMIFCVSF